MSKRDLFEPARRPRLTVAGSDLLFPIRRVFGVGRNYAEHAREMGDDPNREEPFFFTKSPDAVVESVRQTRHCSLLPCGALVRVNCSCWAQDFTFMLQLV